MLRCADRLRNAGHTVHTPDLYDGEFFADTAGAMRKIQELGFDEVLARSKAAVSHFRNELVYAGFSNGGACAELLAASRPGARAAALIGAPLPIRDLGWSTFRAGGPRALFDPRMAAAGVANLPIRYDVAADGKRFLVNTTATDPDGSAAAAITVVMNWQAAVKR
jgi:Dienelactone hydrolase family